MAKNNRYLLDTQIFLWWLNNDKKLKASVKKIIADPNNLVYLSVVSGWEMSIKVHTKKLSLKNSFQKIFKNLQFDLLNVSLEHILRLHKLPFHHKDPFDRMLVAQSKVENLRLITSDKKILKYKVKFLRAN